MKFSTRTLIVLVVLVLCAAVAQAGIVTMGGKPDPAWNTGAMQVWLKADLGVKNSGGNDASDGEKVATWQDQSTYGRNATQSADTKRPGFDFDNLAAGNRATVHFGKADAVDDFLQLAHHFQDTFKGSFTVFGVIIPDDGQPTSSQIWFGTQDGNDTGANRVFNTLKHQGGSHPGEVDFLYKANGTQSVATTDAKPLFSNGTQTAAKVLTLRADSTVGGVGGLRVFADGVEQTLYSTKNGNTSGITFANYSNTNGLYLGACRNANGTPFLPYEGNVAEFLIYKDALSQGEMDDVNGYLNQKYDLGISGLPAPALKHNWKFDETFGTVAHDSVGGLNVTLQNFPGDNSQWLSGDPAAAPNGHGLEFDGLDDVATSNGEPFLEDVTHTVTVWARHDDNLSEPPGPDGTSQRWMSWGNGSHRYFVGPTYIKDGKVDMGISDAYLQSDDPQLLPVQGQWQHWALVRDGDDLKFYVNGDWEDTVTDSSTGSINNAILRIGAQFNGAEFFDGALSDLAIFNIALEQWQIYNVMHCGAENYAIPEPSTLVLLCMGGLALIFIARRRRSKRR